MVERAECLVVEHSWLELLHSLRVQGWELPGHEVLVGDTISEEESRSYI